MKISDLEAWFKSTELPPAPLYLNPATIINDVPHFLESHFAPLRVEPNSKVNQPLLDRLLDLKLLIESNL